MALSLQNNLLEYYLQQNFNTYVYAQRETTCQVVPES